MKSERLLLFSLLFMGLSVVFQTVPAAIGHQLVLLSVFSSLLIFMMTGMSLFLGFAAYIIVGIGTAVVNPYDAVLFWGITGVLGLSGSLWYRLSRSRVAASAATACIMAITTFTINRLLMLYPYRTAYSLPTQFLMLAMGLFPCCLAFVCFAAYIDRQFNHFVQLKDR